MDSQALSPSLGPEHQAPRGNTPADTVSSPRDDAGGPEHGPQLLVGARLRTCRPFAVRRLASRLRPGDLVFFTGALAEVVDAYLPLKPTLAWPDGALSFPVVWHEGAGGPFWHVPLGRDVWTVGPLERDQYRLWRQAGTLPMRDFLPEAAKPPTRAQTEGRLF